MYSRAERRHHVDRLKAARKHIWGYGNPRSIGPEKMSPRELGKAVQNPQICSCAMCGNPRRHKWFKGGCLTLQERSHNEALKTYGSEE